VDFEISITDVRDPVSGAEIDCLISAEPQHRVGDLSAALLAIRGGRDPALPGLWLDGAQLDPAAPLASTGIRAGSRLGFGGPAPVSRGAARPRDPRPGWDAGPGNAAAAPGVPGAPAELRAVSGPDAGLIAPLAPGENVVGRQGGQVRLSNTDVSRMHCVIGVAADGGCTIRDAGSRNGTGLDGVAVGPEPVPVRPGQLIYVGRDVLTITVPDAGNTIMLRADPANPFGWLVNKPPRTSPALPAPVVVDLGGQQSQHGRPPWLTMLIAPALSLATGGAIVALTHQWLFLLLGFGGVAGSLVPQLLNRRTAAGHARTAKREFQDAAAAGQARLSEAIAAEEQLRRQALPDPASLARIAADPGTRLWERTPQDEDFLRLRAGSGDLLASMVSLRGGADVAAGGPEPVVRDVPVAVPLADLGVFGIAGPPAASRPALAWAVSQLAVLHGPSELRLVVLTEEPDAWRWARWLPHLRPLSGATDWLSVGTDPATWTKRITELRDLVARRHAEAAGPRYGPAGPGGPGGRDLALPAVVAVIDGSARIRDVPGIGEVLTSGPSAGVFVICRDDDWRDLPGTCRGRLDTDPASGGTGVYRERETGRPVEVARLDLVTERWADETARALAPIRDRSDEREAGTNATVRLLDLWSVQRPTAAVVSDLWRRGGRTTRVPLGRMADGMPFTLDIASDGPHMLVAGTTGAGKSEFLQTLVASLALGNAPEALVFVLIDYKGGAAFAGASRLPHVTGFLTNLDEHLGRRALVALRAESVYRQRLLAEAGCPDIGGYHAAGEPGGPLPRLVLVVDEFAVLAERMPDFLGELTDVTRQGRSLGIHLVLATQRPAGVVTEDIRSNMALRVCLRVEDPQDSTAVIEIPDAAGIDRRLRGRGYARVQRGAVVQFQGGYVGGLAPGSGPAQAAGTSLRAVRRPFDALGEPPAGGQPAAGSPSGESDLSALVAAMADAGRQAPPHRAWLDPLPELIPLGGLPAARASAAGGLPPVVYGAEDRPAEQAQRLLALDLETGTHLLIGGAPQSGRTTALRTIAASIAAKYSPADVQLYVLDCDAGALAPLQRLPHCGAVVRRTEKDRAARLLDRLAAEVARRQDLLAAAGFSSVTEQRRHAPRHERLPYMVLLLDRWESFSEDLGQQDNMRLANLATRLLSEGAGVGLRIVATGDKTALARVSSHFPERIVLRLANTNDLLLAGVPKGAMPDKPSQGRGVLLHEGTEVQLAFAGQDPSGAAQTAAVDALIERAAAVFPAPVPAPLRVDPLPSRITLAQARALPGWGGRGPLCPAVAVGGDDLAGLGADLTRFPGFAIAGPPLSGRSTALLVVATSLLETGTAVIGLAPRESPLRDLAGRDGVLAVFPDASPDQRKLLELLESASGPAVVLVDDAEALLGTPADALLTQIPVEGRARGQALVIAGTPGELARGMRSFAASARQFKCGLLLTPDDAQQANLLLGTRLTRSAVFDRPPGRGYLVQGGQPTLVQVPELAVSW
jgi:DNA segregation ATPase FtsK/SpoIIIE, S-DNA-T family